MKRIITLFIVFLLCIGLQARDTHWGESIKKYALDPELERSEEYYNNQLIKEKVRKLGQSTELYYIFKYTGDYFYFNTMMYPDYELEGIAYEVVDTSASRKQIERLFDSETFELIEQKNIKMTKEQAKEYKEKIEKKSEEKVIYPALMFMDIKAYNKGETSLLGYLETLKEDETSDIIFIKAQYGYDTDVYIFEGILDGIIIVCYTQTPQDF